jgi:UDP-2-acetamido-3-amino-2,3-dideoxy-glucuronate N-acetyltransferase
MADYFVHESSYVDDGASIGCGTKIWHFCHVQKGAQIGEKCSLGQNVNVADNVKVGNGVKIQNNVSVYEGVELEDYVFCGPSSVFTNDLTPRSKYPKGSAGYKKTLIKYGATIGANATIVCGHTVGRWAMIASGAVVTGDVPDYALMTGVPAKQRGWVCECGMTLKDGAGCRDNGMTLKGGLECNCGPALQGGLKCMDCGREYTLVDGKLEKKALELSDI